MKKMRRGFTMIELIFVIVIIGILAAVAVPKLAENRDDADAAICVEEVSQLINEISEEYSKDGYTEFIKKNVSEMTNIAIIGSTGLTKGIQQDLKVEAPGIIYVCDGKPMLAMAGEVSGPDYKLKVKVANAPGTPTSKIAAEKIIKNIGAINNKSNSTYDKEYKL